MVTVKLDKAYSNSKMNLKKVIESMNKLNSVHENINFRFSSSSKGHQFYQGCLKQDEEEDLRIYGKFSVMQAELTRTQFINSNKSRGENPKMSSLLKKFSRATIAERKTVGLRIYKGLLVWTELKLQLVASEEKWRSKKNQTNASWPLKIFFSETKAPIILAIKQRKVLWQTKNNQSF